MDVMIGLPQAQKGFSVRNEDSEWAIAMKRRGCENINMKIQGADYNWQ